MGPSAAMVDAFKAAWHRADEQGRQGERVQAGLTAALGLLAEGIEGHALPFDYTSSIERNGVEVRVTVNIDPIHQYGDVDETAEFVQLAATRVSAQVHESIARSQLPF